MNVDTSTLGTLADADWRTLLRAVQAEQPRRDALTSIPARMEEMTRTYLAADGQEDGGPWQQPGGAYNAYPIGWKVTHNGKTWESLVPANVWRPGDPSNPLSYTLWREVTDAASDVWDPNGRAYKTGDVVTFDGNRYRAVQAHTSQPGWTPTAVPALWSPV